MTTTANTIDFSSLLPLTRVEDIVREWIHNDMPSYDVGGLVVGTSVHTAKLYLKSDGVFAGKPFVDAIFKVLDCTVKWDDSCKEGDYIHVNPKKKCIATVTGPIHFLLRGERTALNTLSRCSGVATLARQALDKIGDWKGMIAGTRKTTPGLFKLVEKYGLLVGGIATHRLDLSQMCMLKDNHIASCGNSITKAVQLALKACGFSQKIEVECSNVDQAMEAAQAGAHIVMLDNYSDFGKLHSDASHLKQKYPHVLIEASGGITLETMPNYMGPNIDIISKSFTQGYPCLDYSLKVE